MTYLLDTTVVSEVRRRRPDPGVVEWLGTVASNDLHLSALTIGELRRGTELLRRRDARAAGALGMWLAGLVADHGDRIVDVDAVAARRWGELGVPDPLPVVDGLLAATALARDWTLVTRNTADVKGHRREGVQPLPRRLNHRDPCRPSCSPASAVTRTRCGPPALGGPRRSACSCSDGVRVSRSRVRPDAPVFRAVLSSAPTCRGGGEERAG